MEEREREREGKSQKDQCQGFLFWAGHLSFLYCFISLIIYTAFFSLFIPILIFLFGFWFSNFSVFFLSSFIHLLSISSFYTSILSIIYTKSESKTTTTTTTTAHSLLFYFVCISSILRLYGLFAVLYIPLLFT